MIDQVMNVIGKFYLFQLNRPRELFSIVASRRAGTTQLIFLPLCRWIILKTFFRYIFLEGGFLPVGVVFDFFDRLSCVKCRYAE